ncbi:histidine kinase, partial [Planoprotostelium fungivorum]
VSIDCNASDVRMDDETLEILLALLSRVAQVSPANSMEDVQSLMKNHLASILVVDITLVSLRPLILKRSEIELPLHQVTPLKTPLKQSNIISSISAAFERMKKPEIPTESLSPNAGADEEGARGGYDNGLNRKMVCKMLEPLGFQLDCVVDGKLAVEASYHNRYDAILMDVQMPVMDRLQATEIIQQKEALQMRRTPIIGLSASVSEHDQRVCYDAGMDDFVPKLSEWEIHKITNIWDVIYWNNTAFFIPSKEPKLPLNSSQLADKYRASYHTVNRELHHILPIIYCHLNFIRWPTSPLQRSWCGTIGQASLYHGDKHAHFYNAQVMVTYDCDIINIKFVIGHNNDSGVSQISGTDDDHCNSKNERADDCVGKNLQTDPKWPIGAKLLLLKSQTLGSFHSAWWKVILTH